MKQPSVKLFILLLLLTACPTQDSSTTGSSSEESAPEHSDGEASDDSIEDAEGQNGNNPTDESPMDEPPIDESPTNESPMDEPLIDESPTNETPIDETPINESPIDESPIDEPPIDEPPADDGDTTVTVPTTADQWTVVYNGYGSVGFDAVEGIVMEPQIPAGGNTHAALVLAEITETCPINDFRLTLSATTEEQLRTTNPNPWEVFWIFFNYLPDGAAKTTISASAQVS